MKESPILFSAPMVRAILEGRKTQTRRVLQLHGIDGVQKDHNQWRFCEFHDNPRRAVFQGTNFLHRVITENCRYGVEGDRLWVKETYGIGGARLIDPCVNYRADGSQKPLLRGHGYSYLAGSPHVATDSELLKVPDGWRPSIFMYRWASRIDLEITGLRVQRLHDITEEDAKAEGVEPAEKYGTLGPYVTSFARLWNDLNSERGFGWGTNSWVWNPIFRMVRP
jgi:hypothetical protein